MNFIEKIPKFIRWILAPVIGIAIVIFTPGIIKFLMSLIWATYPITLLQLLLLDILPQILAAYFGLIIASHLWTEQGKGIVLTILTTLLSIVFILNIIFYFPTFGDDWQIIVAAAVSIVVMIVTTVGQYKSDREYFGLTIINTERNDPNETIQID